MTAADAFVGAHLLLLCVYVRVHAAGQRIAHLKMAGVFLCADDAHQLCVRVLPEGEGVRKRAPHQRALWYTGSVCRGGVLLCLVQHVVSALSSSSASYCIVPSAPSSGIIRGSTAGWHLLLSKERRSSFPSLYKTCCAVVPD